MGKKTKSGNLQSYDPISSQQIRAKTLPHQKILLPQNKSKDSKVLLLIDDSIVDRHTINIILKQANYQVIQVADGVEALEKLSESHTINLIICDLDMPRMNGFEFLRALAQNPQFNEIPAIVLTSNDSQTYRDLALQLGASAFLSKPYSEQNLLDTIARLLSDVS